MNTQSPIPVSALELEEMIVLAVRDLFSTMLSSSELVREGMAQTIEPLSEDFPSSDGDTVITPDSLIRELQGELVVSSVGLVGCFSGMFNIYVEEELAEELTMEFLGMKLEELEDDIYETVNDTIGEFGNIIIGNLKNSLYEHGISTKIAIPTIIRGCGFSLSGLKKPPKMCLKFSVNERTLLFEMLIKPGKSNSS